MHDVRISRRATKKYSMRLWHLCDGWLIKLFSVLTIMLNRPSQSDNKFHLAPLSRTRFDPHPSPLSPLYDRAPCDDYNRCHSAHVQRQMNCRCNHNRDVSAASFHHTWRHIQVNTPCGTYSALSPSWPSRDDLTQLKTSKVLPYSFHDLWSISLFRHTTFDSIYCDQLLDVRWDTNYWQVYI